MSAETDLADRLNGLLDDVTDWKRPTWQLMIFALFHPFEFGRGVGIAQAIVAIMDECAPE